MSAFHGGDLHSLTTHPDTKEFETEREAGAGGEYCLGWTPIKWPFTARSHA